MKLAKFSIVVVVFSMMASMALAQQPGGGRQGRGNRGGNQGLLDSALKPLTDAIDKLTDLPTIKSRRSPT